MRVIRKSTAILCFPGCDAARQAVCLASTFKQAATSVAVMAKRARGNVESSCLL
jgi:hypothetical protein